MAECDAAIFAWILHFFLSSLSRSGGLSPGEEWDAVGLNCEKDTATDIGDQMPNTWVMG